MNENKITKIKNKQKRIEVYKKLKSEKNKEKREERKKRKREREELGENAPPLQVYFIYK